VYYEFSVGSDFLDYDYEDGSNSDYDYDYEDQYFIDIEYFEDYDDPNNY
jgi:hypothetical protein